MRRKIIFLIVILILSTVLTSYTWASTVTPNVEIKEKSNEIEVVEITEEPEPEPEPEIYIPYTNSEIDLIALVTMAEAEGESELGKRLVIDVILNRLDQGFASSISGVIYAKNQFECMINGRVDRCVVRDDIRQLVIEEMKNRTNYEVLYFRTTYYHNFGTPLFNEGAHYFSK